MGSEIVYTLRFCRKCNTPAGSKPRCFKCGTSLLRESKQPRSALSLLTSVAARIRAVFTREKIKKHRVKVIYSVAAIAGLWMSIRVATSIGAENERHASLSATRVNSPGARVSNSAPSTLSDAIQSVAIKNGLNLSNSQLEDVSQYAADASRTYGISHGEAAAAYIGLRVNPDDRHSHIDALLNLDAVLRVIYKGR